jgi:hypothetical protein
MNDPSRYHWYGEEPFPWIGVAWGAVLGLLLFPVLSWIGFELLDQNLEGLIG